MELKGVRWNEKKNKLGKGLSSIPFYNLSRGTLLPHPDEIIGVLATRISNLNEFEVSSRCVTKKSLECVADGL